MVLEENTLGNDINKILDKIIKILDKLSPELINAVKDLISSIAEFLGLKNKDEKLEDIGLKEEKSNKKSEDFNSKEEYMNYLKNEVKLDSSDKEKLNNEGLKEIYFNKGLELGIGAINEKLGTNLSLEDVIKLAKAGVENPKDFITILDTFKEKEVEPKISDAIDKKTTIKEKVEVIGTLKEGVSKIENSKEIWNKLDNMLEDI
jgi:hypothetical protein